MSRLFSSTALVALCASSAFAGGIDRSRQSILEIYETGTYGELGFGNISPSVSGTDAQMFGGGPTGDVAKDYTQAHLAFKQDIDDKWSYAVILDQPFGADLVYGASSVAFGGTIVDAHITSLTGVLRYKFNSNFSMVGGLRASRASGQIGLQGAAYGPFSGYLASFSPDTGLGYVLGAAYEKPEIALRVALTYNSATDHTMDTVETFNGFVIGTTPTDTSSPQTINLDAQTGIAKDTLLFGQIRWADWSEFQVDPATFTALSGEGLVDLEDTTTFTLGVGHKFNETWSGAASMEYEAGGDILVSPLAPTNGFVGMTLAAIYTTGNTKITTGINYTKLGDADPETGTPDQARAYMVDNSAVSVGMRIGVHF